MSSATAARKTDPAPMGRARPAVRQGRTAAPQPRFRVVTEASPANRAREQRVLALPTTAAIAAGCVMALVLVVSAAINVRASYVLQDVDQLIENAQLDQRELIARRNSLMSPDKITRLAAPRLGMHAPLAMEYLKVPGASVPAGPTSAAR